ncbi:hypothetical protein EDD18DRAFT_1327961 [Armillaria luteobubalina]|uniref:Uncharacterized protein n=1 Tax=Armillaria luteobubalina TaxID=153913 RepID=A0AA39TW64_9AGAR|nr:hypothetical protein EDD18DRAFT_1327961 [Armillaria luteobubalina]
MDEELMNLLTDCLKEISPRCSTAGASRAGSIDDGKRINSITRKENTLWQRHFCAFWETNMDLEDSKMNEASVPSACVEQWGESTAGEAVYGSREDVVITYCGICQPPAEASDHNLSPLEVWRVHDCKIVLSYLHAECNGNIPIQDRALVTLVDRLVVQVASQCLAVKWTDLNLSTLNFVANRLGLNKLFRVTLLTLLGSEEHVYSTTDGEGADELVVGRRLQWCSVCVKKVLIPSMILLTRYLRCWGISLSASKASAHTRATTRTLFRIPERIMIPHRLKGFQLKMVDYVNYVKSR